MSNTETKKKEYTIGEEIMRVWHSGSQPVKEMKQKFSELFNQITEHVSKAEEEINNPPKIMSDETIRKHTEVIRRGEELMRCMAEAGRYLELACMWAVKGVTA